MSDNKEKHKLFILKKKKYIHSFEENHSTKVQAFMFAYLFWINIIYKYLQFLPIRALTFLELL